MIRQYKCPICLDTGEIRYFKKIGNTTYEYTCHCTCSEGNKYRYRGGDCEKRPSNYYWPSIEECLDKNEVAKENIKSLLDTYGKERIKEVLRV